VTGVLFGTAPAWLATHAEPAEALRGANRSAGDRSSVSQKILVVVQAALSVVLLAGAGLLTHSLEKLQHQDMGYEVERRVTLSLTAPFSTYTPAKLDAMYRELQDRLAHLPGVQRAALAQYTPLQDNWGEIVIRQGHGMPNMNATTGIGSSWDHVYPGYLETMGQQIVRGRSLTEQDTATTQPVVVVDETFVKHFFKPGEEPLGSHFGLDLPRYNNTFEIVGIVRNAKYNDVANQEPRRPIFFLPLTQRVKYDEPLMQSIEDMTHYIEGAVLEVRGSMEGLEPAVRRTLSEVDPNLTLLTLQSMQEQVDQNFDQRRAVARMTALFGLLALVLAAVGLYGVTAYTVERRTSEIGVRMALGADRMNVIRLVLRGAFAQVLVGLAIGIPVSIGTSRLISAQLYQVKGWDPVVLGGAMLALSLCALVASIIPAQRAASINPVTALRAE
jgi:predicted permease